MAMAMAMTNSIHVKEAIVVTPSEPTPNRVLSLSSIDSQLFLRFTIEYLFVYKQTSTTSSISQQKSFTARVKHALSRVLVPYYPLAGRVRSKPDGSGLLEVVCRAQGAVFIEAEANHTINDFERAPRSVTQWRKLLSVMDKGAPPLVIQLTWLKDGAATIGVGINHCLCDGIGTGEFLNSFAELVSIQQQQRNVMTKGNIVFKPKPIWDRHLLEYSTPRVNSSLTNHHHHHHQYHPEFNRVPDLCAFMNRFTNERLVPTSIVFDNRKLNELKRLSESSSSSYTSFEVLSAHIWRSWARSLNLPPNQILKLLFSVNIRQRVKPSLLSGYYGNAFVLGCAQTSVKDLIDKGLRYASELVKRAKEKIDHDYVKSVVESVSRYKASPDSVGVLILSQWSRLGLERVDFGLGKPVHVGPICCDRYCLMLPVFNQTDAVRVMLAVPTSAFEKYDTLVKAGSY
ncbi:hypothetical protein ACFE04_018330 [Oxalis oulophora]